MTKTSSPGEVDRLISVTVNGTVWPTRTTGAITMSNAKPGKSGVVGISSKGTGAAGGGTSGTAAASSVGTGGTGIKVYLDVS